jgi:Ankyrin repeats (many copies)
MTTDSTQDKELLERYRRASDSEAAAPSEAVRAAILAEGRRVAAQQAIRAPKHTVDSSRPAANDARWKITAFGTAGAAILAALLFAPRYWESRMTPMHAKTAPAAAPAPAQASKSEAAPVPESADAAQEPLALEPRKNLRIAPERPHVETIAPSTAAENYAPAPPVAAAPAPAPRASQLAAPPSSSPAFVSGAQSMSADRVAAARMGPPAATLMSAAESGDLAQATELLDHGAPVDARDELGRTALMLAAAQGRLDVVRLLLERGADPNAADNAGRTPLQQAKQKNLAEVVALLERAGAR